MRFPEFKGEWEETTLGKCVTQPLDYGMNAAAIAYDGENKYIRITDIDEQSSQYISDEPVSPAGQLLDKYIVKENDILFARTGASTGKTYLYKKKDGKLYFAGFLIRAKIKTEYNSAFIFAQTKTVQYYKWVEFMSIRSGQPGINSQEYASYKFLIPQKEEQDKIATLFSLLDHRILIQSKIIEDLKVLQDSLIDYYYRLQRYDKSVLLIDCISQISERNKKNNAFPVLSVSNKYGFIQQIEQFENRKIASEDISNYKIVRKNDFAYNPARINVGSIAKLIKYSNGIVSPMYICFRAKDNFSPDFLEFYFKSKQFKNEVLKRLEGSVRQCLPFEGLCDIPVVFPPKEKQKDIITQLSAIQTKIEIETTIKELLLKQKQHLLRQMFI